jgi:hypothetical protein
VEVQWHWDRFVVDSGNETGWGEHSGTGAGLLWAVVVRKIGVGTVALGQVCCGQW